MHSDYRRSLTADTAALPQAACEHARCLQMQRLITPKSDGLQGALATQVLPSSVCWKPPTWTMDVVCCAKICGCPFEAI